MPDGSIINIETVKPVSDDQIKFQVAQALSLGLPEVQQGPVTQTRLFIYANGPSAASAPIMYPCMALNGACKVLYAKGYRPTWWAACDPQEIVRSFIEDNAQAHAAFLLASQCHPAVFERLHYQIQSGKVQLWHVNGPAFDMFDDKTIMPDTPSITLSSLFLAYYMGFRDITVFGWDGCYIDGEHHAAGQPHNNTNNVTADINGKTFETTYTWLAEAEDAVKVINMLPDMKLAVEGDGLIAHVLGPILEHKRGNANNASTGYCGG